MAKNNALKDTDLIQKDPFNNAIEGANKLLVVVDNLKGSIKELAGEQKNIIKLFDPKDAESLKRFSSELDKAKQTTDAYNSALATEAQVKIQLSKLQQQEAKTTAEITRTTRVQTNEIAKQNKELQAQLINDNKAIEAKRKLNSLYLQERKLRNDLGNEIRDLTLAGKAETEQVKKLRVEFEGLDKRIRGVDESLGRYTDNVGNYPQQLRAMQIELQKLDAGSDEFKSLAKEAGVLKDKINDAKDATKAFASGSKFQQGGNLFGQIKNDLLDLDFGGASDKAKQLAGVVKSITVAELVTGVKDLGTTFLNLGKSLLTNPIFILAAVLTGISIAIYQVVNSFNDLNKTTETVAENSKKVAERLDTLAKKNEEFAIRLKVATGKISKENADVLLSDLNNKDERIKIQREFSEVVTKLATELNVDVSKLRNGRLEEGYRGDIIEQNNNKRFNNELIKLRKNFNKEYLETSKTQVNERILLLAEQAKNEKEKQAEEDKKTTDKIKAKHKKDLELQKKHSEDITKAKQDEYARLNSLYEQYLTSQKNIAQAEAELITINQKIVQDNTDFEIKQQEKLGIATEAKIRTLFATKGIDLAEKNTNKIREIENTRYSEQVEQDTEIRNAKLLEQEQLYTQASVLLEQDKQAELDKLKTKQVEKEKAKDAEILANKKKLANESIDIAKQTVDAIANEIKREGDLRNKAFDEQISAREKSITRQQELADKGANNTLAFQKEQLAKDKLAKAEAEKSELRKLNTIAFIQEFTALLKDNPKTALPKAIINAGLRKAIQASFIDGTENVGKDKQMQGYKMHNGTDGYHAPVIAFDGNERILNPKHNAMIGAMSNLELAKLAYNYQHGTLAANNIVVTSDAKMAVNIEKMTNEMVALNKALQSKQSDTINWDSQNQFVINSVQNGMQKVIKQQIQAPRL